MQTTTIAPTSTSTSTVPPVCNMLLSYFYNNKQIEFWRMNRFERIKLSEMFFLFSVWAIAKTMIEIKFIASLFR